MTETGAILRSQEVVKSGLTNGQTCAVSPWQIDNYQLIRTEVNGTPAGNGAVTVTINGSNVLVKFIYRANQVQPNTYILYGEWGYYEGNQWRVLQGATEIGRYAAGATYDHTTTKTFSGYRVVRARATGVMPASNHTVQFVYEKNSTVVIPTKHTLYARYGCYSGGSWHDLAAQATIGTYNAGDVYKAYPIPIADWSPIDPYQTGTMPDHDHTLYFVYVQGNDGDGVKNPLEDPVHNGDGDNGGGDNQSTDGPGEFQPDKPPVQDYPETPADNPVINTPSNVPVEPDEGNETHDGNSTGTGGTDHPVIDPDASLNDNSDPPDTTTPIPVDPNTSGTITETNPGGGDDNPNVSLNPGDTTNPADQPEIGGTVDAGW